MFSPLSSVSAAPKDADWDHDGHRNIRHVLLISIDGMHAVDFKNCVASRTCPHLAELGETGVTYTRTTTSRPSDSLPGLMALVTGGTPRTVGAYYDVAYDRVLAPPATATGNGLPAGTCTEGVINGTETEYEEGDEIDQTKLNGGFSGYSLIDGGIKSIDPTKLIRDPFNGCNPVYPWNFVRTNTIYGVIHKAGGYTAWSDKHAVYAVVSGPTGTSQPSNVDDYYSPEVNSNQISLPGIVTATESGQSGVDCAKIAPSCNDWTTDFDAIKCYDQLKVNAVVNWISGKTHLGGSKAPVPEIFGMNFQAVSVGQKLISPASATRTDANSGGYEDAQGTPRPKMLAEIQFVDAAIGQMVDALEDHRLLDSTAIIITAKHGQSPIDPNRFFPIPGNSGTNGMPPSAIISSFLPAIFNDPNNGLGIAEDDISQLWLTDSGRTADAVAGSKLPGTPLDWARFYLAPRLPPCSILPACPSIPGHAAGYAKVATRVPRTSSYFQTSAWSILAGSRNNPSTAVSPGMIPT
jgi:hypothetical protein